MTENLKESSKSQQKKNVFTKIKENIDDKDEQLAFISVVVRLVVVAWSGFIVSLNYVSIPGYSNEPKDITFPASILTGVRFPVSVWMLLVKKEISLKILLVNLMQ